MNFKQRSYDTVTTFFGSLLSLFSGRAAVSYVSGRHQYRSYVAGTTRGANKKWLPRNTSGDAEIKRGIKMITARCRDLARNNPYIKGAIRKICDNVIRNGIFPQFRIKGRDGKPDVAMNTLFEKHFRRWGKKKYCDISGHDSIASIQKLVLRHIWTDGEVLIHRVWDRSMRKTGVAPFRLEVLECDMLADFVDGPMKNGNIARRGIEMDAQTGRPVAYHILPNHPGDYQFIHYNDIRVLDAGDVIHVYEKERASQTRGVSWFVAIIMEAFDLSEYQSFERIGAKLAAAFGLFIKSQYPEMMGGGPAIGTTTNGLTDVGEYIEPGRIQMLPVGTEIQIASHKRPGETYEPYVKQSLKSLSAGSGMSYGAFANDRSDSSYSAERSSQLDERLSYQGQQNFINEKMNDRLAEWFVEGLYLAGIMIMPAYEKDPDAYTDVEWQNPGWTWVDPANDSKAANMDLANCTTTRRRIAGNRGDDWDETMDQLIREEDRLIDLARKRAERLKIEEAVNA